MNDYYPVDPQLYRVTHFEFVGDYTLRLLFNDETEQVIDFEPILVGEIFGLLKDKELFAEVQLEQIFGTLEWPNGADISPTTLHDWPDHVEAIIARRHEELAAV